MREPVGHPNTPRGRRLTEAGTVSHVRTTSFTPDRKRFVSAAYPAVVFRIQVCFGEVCARGARGRSVRRRRPRRLAAHAELPRQVRDASCSRGVARWPRRKHPTADFRARDENCVLCTRNGGHQARMSIFSAAEDCNGELRCGAKLIKNQATVPRCRGIPPKDCAMIAGLKWPVRLKP